MASAKDKLGAVLTRLEEYYGTPDLVVKSRDPVEQVILHIVGDGASKDKARRAFRELCDRFVDWNEARVALAEHLRAALEPVGREVFERAWLVHAFLNGLFERKHTMEMAFLAEMTPDEVVEFLSQFEGVDTGAAALAMCLALPQPEVLLSTPLIRVAQRSGVLARGSAGEKARAALEKLVEPDDRLRLHGLLARLGEEICKARNPACARCPLVALCPTGRKSAPGAEPPAKAPPVPRPEIVRRVHEPVAIPGMSPEPVPAPAASKGGGDGKGARRRTKPPRAKSPPPAPAETVPVVVARSTQRAGTKKPVTRKKPVASEPAREKPAKMAGGAKPAKRKPAPKKTSSRPATRSGGRKTKSRST